MKKKNEPPVATGMMAEADRQFHSAAASRSQDRLDGVRDVRSAFNASLHPMGKYRIK